MKLKTELPSYKCAVCESILIIHEKHRVIKCHFCETPFATIVDCEKGHFVCPWCDEKHGVKPKDDEKEREEARELDGDGIDRFGTVHVLLMSCVSPDRAEDLGDLYDIDHDFDKEEL